jgi:hypothetical protein
MSEWNGAWHAVHVVIHDDEEIDTDVLHPASCPIAIYDPPNDWGGVRHYQCDFQREVDEGTLVDLLPNKPMDVWYVMHAWVEEYHNWETGPEYDGGLAGGMWRIADGKADKKIVIKQLLPEI